MKCDKCGFEHNSRSTCPKCGANVVFVNSDYERRKKEWEEAQKSGKGKMLPPGIMHSTKEEHDIKNGRDRFIHVKEEGGSEMTGLSLVKIKEKVIRFLAKIIVKNRERKRRKQNEDSKLEFSDKKESLKENLDNSKLVLSHKVFKDRRKLFLIIGIIVVVLGVGIPVAVHNIKRIDQSKVYYFDGTSCYKIGKEEPIFITGENSIVVDEKENAFLVSSDIGIFWISENNIDSISAIKPTVISYNKDYSAIIYKTEDKLFFYKTNGENTELKCENTNAYEKGCQISSNGEYFIVTVLEQEDEDCTYYTYFGTASNYSKISENVQQKEVINVYDDGKCLYLDMENGEYGIVNDREVIFYDGKKINTLVNNIQDYIFVENKNSLYYIDESDYLYVMEDSVSTKIDDNVLNFVENKMEKNKVFYMKSDGCYMADKESDYNTPLFTTNLTDITLYYNIENGFFYFTDVNNVYFVNKPGQTATKVCSYNYGDVMKTNNAGTYMIDAAGELRQFNKINTSLTKNAANLLMIDSRDGLSYAKGNSHIIKYDYGKKMITVSDTEIDILWKQIVYSDKCFYIITEKNELYRLYEKNEKIKLVGNAKLCIFMK